MHLNFCRISELPLCGRNLPLVHYTSLSSLEPVNLNLPELAFVGYRPEYGLEVVKMWRRSFQRAMGIEEHNRLDELEGHLDYFAAVDSKDIQIALDTRASSVVGLMTLSDEELHHLFVHVDYQNCGIGSKFMARAKARKPLGLSLYTFQKNVGAQKFYLAHGFKEVQRGFADFEGNPWAKVKEDLADIKYHWSPD